MKRFLALVIITLYLASSLGITVHVHYCMGKIEGISLLQGEKERCGRCGMKKAESKKGCCNDKYKTFKVTDHKLCEKANNQSNIFFSASIPTITLYGIGSGYHDANCSKGSIVQQALVRGDCPIYLRVRNIRI